MPFSVPGHTVELLRRSTVRVTTGEGYEHGCGSGIVLNGGRVLTNAHVVRGSQVCIEPWNGPAQQAEVLKVDQRRDLALLRADGLDAPAVSFAGSTVEPGQPVIAVGNPLGFAGAVSKGFVYTTGRLRGLGETPWIQSDLRLAPGNSGGPLADVHGDLLGVNTMIIAGGPALAIPASAIQRFLTITQPTRSLGVIVRPIAFESSDARRQRGLLVLELVNGGAAECASLLPGDILVAANGTPLASPADLFSVLDASDTVRFFFFRGSRQAQRQVTVRLVPTPLMSAA